MVQNGFQGYVGILLAEGDMELPQISGVPRKRLPNRVKVVLSIPKVFFYPKKKHISKLAKITTGVLRTSFALGFVLFVS